jgi:tetratricopeptide (TPR) repeat protein
MNYYCTCSAAILGVSVALVQVQAVRAISKAEIGKTARGVTVLIQDAQNPKSSGSGVIIKREGQTYTVLTAQHVVQSSSTLKVMTSDEKQHSVIQGSIQKFPDVDLALIQFTSTGAYSIAKMGDSDKSPLGTASFVAGFPGTTAVRSEPTFYFTSGEIAANANRPLKDGYAIAYNNPTLPGMSGGPVLNENGELIGIHGRAENAAVPQNVQLREDIYVLKTEFNYAVPINTFLTMAPKVNNTFAFQAPSTPTSSAPKGDDFFLQADTKLSKGDYKGALADFNQVLRLNPNYKAAYTGRGVARGGLGDLKGAIEDLSQALQIDPNNIRALAARGDWRFEAGDKQGAEADLKQSLKISMDAEDYKAYMNRGNLRKNLGDKQGALADYNQAIRINPNFAFAYSNRGSFRLGLGDKQGALADYNQAIRINPNFADAFVNRGVIRIQSGDRQGAIADFDQAIRINPNFALAYSNRGNVRHELGNKQGALADFDQALRINPNFASAYNNRGKVRFDLGDKWGTIADFDQAIRLNPNYAEAYYNRGNAHSEFGNKQDAIADFKKAAALFKEQGNYSYHQRAIGKLRKIGYL